MPGQQADTAALSYAPHTQRAVTAPAHQVTAVWMEAAATKRGESGERAVICDNNSMMPSLNYMVGTVPNCSKNIVGISNRFNNIINIII